MLERDVLKVVGDMLDRFQWEWWHVPMPVVADRSRNRGFRPYKKAGGLPDIFALHREPPRMLILELKGSKGKLSDDQRKFLTLARDVSERTWQEPFKDWIDPHQPPVSFGGGKAIATYVIGPENIDTLEQILRTRVLP